MSESYGVVTATRTVRIERVLPGRIERVWEYLTDANLRGTWLASGPMELQVGGKVELNFYNSKLTPNHVEEIPEKFMPYAHEVRQWGTITKCDPPKLIAFTWDQGSKNPSEVMFELTARGEETLLVVTHYKLPSRGQMVGVSSGWHTHLNVLEDKMRDMPPRPLWATLTRVMEVYEKQIPPEA